jgi:hydrogenase maturation protease
MRRSPCRCSNKLIVARSLILGIGNVLLRDDGAGVHAASLLAQQFAGRDDVRVLDAGTLSFTLAPLVENSERLIVLDAMQLDAPPGTVRRFLDEGVDAALGRARLSVHELGLRDVLQLACLSGRCPTRRALIGIQPGSLDWGTAPTNAVSAALPAAAALAAELLEFWPTPDQVRKTS